MNFCVIEIYNHLTDFQHIGRFDSLKKTIDKEKVMKFMRECAVGVSVSPVIAQIRFSRLLEDFIRKGPVSIELVRLWARKLMERKQQ